MLFFSVFSLIFVNNNLIMFFCLILLYRCIFNINYMFKFYNNFNILFGILSNLNFI